MKYPGDRIKDDVPTILGAAVMLLAWIAFGIFVAVVVLSSII